MSGNDDSLAPEQSSASLTSSRLHNLVLEHMLENPRLFILGDKPQLNAVEHFKDVLDSLVALAHQVATESLVNRHHLSPLPTFDGSIDANPDTDKTGQRYELRYRLVEQIGDEKPYKDNRDDCSGRHRTSTVTASSTTTGADWVSIALAASLPPATGLSGSP